MARLLTTLVALVAAVPLVPAAPVPTHLMPKDPPLTFPTTVGTKWVYTLANGAEQTIVISEVKEEKDGSKLVTTEYVENGQRTPHQVKRVSVQGVFVLVDHGQKFEEPLCIVQYPLREGRTWETAHRRVGETDESKGRRVAGPTKQLRVPAGEFSAASIDWELKNGRGTNWYTNGIGLVKTDGYQELKSFTPGKD
jgi:hypothetical protein